MKKFTFLFRVANLMLLFSILGGYAAIAKSNGNEPVFLGNSSGVPTLGTVTVAAVCINEPATVVLTGLIPGMTGDATYTINGGSPQIKSGTASPTGTFTFTTPPLTLANSGAIINITRIRNFNPVSQTLFTGKTATLFVNQKPTLTSVTTTATCDGSSTIVLLTGLLPSTSGVASFTLGGGAVLTQAGTSSPAGTFSFTSAPLALNQNGMELKIIKITNGGTCETMFTNMSTFLVVNAKPTLTAVTAAPVCSGASATIVLSGLIANTSGVATYKIGNGLPQTQAGISTSTGTFSFVTSALSAAANNLVVEITKITNQNGCETIFTGKTVSLVVNPLPMVTASNNGPICDGATLNLSSTGGTSYSWSGPSSFTSTAQNPSFAATVAASGTYTVNVTNASGCVNTANTTVVVNPLPMVTASNNGPICDGATLNLSSTGGTSYSWSGPSSFTSTDQNPSFTASVAASGNYSVTVTDANGCVNTANTEVLVNPLPTVVITGTPIVCQGSAFNLSASGASSYAWSGSVGSNNGVGAGRFTSSSPSISRSLNGLTQYHRVGDYTVTGTDVNGCKNTATETVGVNPVLTLNTLPILPPVCEGSDFTINSIATIANVTKINSFPYYTIAAGNSNDISYAWSGPNGFGSTSNNAFVSNAASANAGTYALTITGPGGCTRSVTRNVTVNPNPTITLDATASVCFGSNITLTASSNGTVLSWFKNGNPIGLGASLTITSADLSDAGTYTFRARNLPSLCISEQSIELIVNPLPMVTASNNGPICDGATLNLSSTVGTSYSWNGPSSFTSTDQNPSFTASVAASGNYSVTVTDANGCVNTANTEVLVNPLPTVVITGTPIVCQGSTFNLSASGASSYAWSGSVGSNNGVGAGRFTSSSPSISRSLNGLTQYHRVGDYTVTGTDVNGCKNTATETVGVYPVLTLNTLPILPPVCEGSDFTINSIATIANVTKINSFPYYTVAAGNSNDISYAWSGPNGFASTSNNAFVSNAISANAGTYALTISGPGGCTRSVTRNVTVNPNPTITLDATASVCFGSNITLTASSNGSVLSWFKNGNPIGLGVSLTITSADLSDAGTYTFRARNLPSLCISEQSIELIVNPLPMVTASNNGPICDGATLNLSSTVGTSYSWSGPSSFTSTDQNPSFTASVAASGNYSVTVTDANGCVNTANTEVLVNPLPTVVITGTPIVCQGSTFNLSASGASSYAWSGSVGSNNGVGAGRFTSSSPSISRSLNGLTQYHRVGDYTVTGTDVNGCKNTATETVGVNPVLTLNTLPILPPVCEGSDFTINSIATIANVTKINSFPYYTIAAGNSNDISYAWSGPNGFASTSNNAFVSNAISANAGTYALTITGPGGCTRSVTRNVTVNPNPTITLDATASVCFGSNITLTASSNGTVLSWFKNGNPIGLGASLTITSADLSDAGTYTFRARNLPSLCISEQSIELIVNPLPMVTASNNGPICDGATLNLSSTGGTSYFWSGPSSFTSTDQNPSFTATVASSGTYTVTVTDANGCVNTANTEVLVNPLPTVVITGTPIVCQGSTFNLSASGASSYAWSGSVGSNNGVGAGRFTSSSPSISRSLNGLTQYHRVGDYTVTGTDVNGCKNTATETVGVNPVLTLNTLPILPPVCEGSDFTINSIATIANVTKINSFPYYTIAAGNSNDISYAWSGPNGFASTSNNAFVSNAASANAGTYALTITGPGGCTRSVTRNVTVNPNPTITLDATASVCFGSNITLTASSNGSILSWFKNGNLVGLGASLTITSVDLSDAGTYTFRARNLPSLCISEQSIEVVVNLNPTLSTVTSMPVCAGNVANIVLSGLLPNTAGVATYKVGNGPLQTQAGVSTASGTFSFATQVLIAAANGSIIEIIKIVNDGTGCETNFTNKKVTLTVYRRPTLSTVTSMPVCAGNVANIFLSGLLPNTAGVATYKVGNGPLQIQAGVSTASGTFSFATQTLIAAANGSIIEIIKIVNDDTGCETTFTNKKVTLVVHPAPTLANVTAASVLAGNSATIVLSGLLANTSAFATYKIGNGSPQMQPGTSTAAGTFSFVTSALGASANNLVVEITKITNTVTGCESTFTNKTVILEVNQVERDSDDTALPVIPNSTNSTFETESQLDAKIVLFPNPVSDVVNIQTTLGIKSVEFLNVHGQRVLTSNQKQIDVSLLPSGIYLVQIQDLGDNVTIKKIIKK